MNKAFSIVEISIALVIIGALVAATVGGAKLVEHSKVQKYISAIENADLAIATFRTTYDGLPGDFDDASSFGLGTDGNGNRVIEHWSNHESNTYIWNHLKAAGLYNEINMGSSFVGGSPDGTSEIILWKEEHSNIIASTFSTTKVTGMTKNSQIQIISSKDNGLRGGADHAISARHAYYLDRKMDDGTANTGYIISSIDTTHISDADECGSASVYDINTKGVSCLLFYDMPSLRPDQ